MDKTTFNSVNDQEIDEKESLIYAISVDRTAFLESLFSFGASKAKDAKAKSVKAATMVSSGTLGVVEVTGELELEDELDGEAGAAVG